MYYTTKYLIMSLLDIGFSFFSSSVCLIQYSMPTLFDYCSIIDKVVIYYPVLNNNVYNTVFTYNVDVWLKRYLLTTLFIIQYVITMLFYYNVVYHTVLRSMLLSYTVFDNNVAFITMFFMASPAFATMLLYVRMLQPYTDLFYPSSFKEALEINISM